MTNTKQLTSDIFWVGANDKRLQLFENSYTIPNGISYNSYIIMDEQTALMDTVDSSVADCFFENIGFILNGRPLDYVVVQHMEPDHSATLARLIQKYPQVTIVCNAKTETIIHQFFREDLVFNVKLVTDGEELSIGQHTLHFIMAPMVHWPEVMMTYEQFSKILFSADAFGNFGTLDGALFTDNIASKADYLNEARRYYANIVGKYGPPVQNVLKKASQLDIQMICPLHGLSWNKDLPIILDKYQLWSTYKPEDQAVVIAYASIYGNTAKVAQKAASLLAERNWPVCVYDLSKTPTDTVLSDIFRASHLILASATHDGGLFAPMTHLIEEMVAHNVQSRTIALIENGSWAPMAAKEMKRILEPLNNIRFIEPVLSIKSTLSIAQEDDLKQLVTSLIT